MGAPKVSRAIFTTSMARTTPAQKPRGLSRRTRFSVGAESDCWKEVGVSSVVAVTPISISCREGAVKRINNLGEVIQWMLILRRRQRKTESGPVLCETPSMNAVKLSRSAAQNLLRKQPCPILADFTIPQHTGERQAQRLAGIAAGDPRRLLPTHRVGERIAVGSEHDFVRIGFQPLAQPDCHGSGWEGEGLLG